MHLARVSHNLATSAQLAPNYMYQPSLALECLCPDVFMCSRFYALCAHSMWGNGIGDAGAKALGEALVTNTSLRELMCAAALYPWRSHSSQGFR